MKQRIVMKFGGTSVGSANAIRKVVAIIQNNNSLDYEIAIVVSAAVGITDLLNLCISQALGVENGNYSITLSIIKGRLQEIAEKLLRLKPDKENFFDILNKFLEEALDDCKKVKGNAENLPEIKDRILSIGERAQIYLVSSALNQSGLESVPLQASDFIITNNSFLEATPLQPITNEKIKERLEPFLLKGIIPVISGFIGSTSDGKLTTLGRGGSDFSAAIIAAGLDANEVWIWTDVDGMMTTDPSLITNTRLVTEISYKEVYDHAFFGARVLHPKTIQPLEGKKIPIQIKNTFKEKNQGTHIHLSVKNSKRNLKAVTGIKRVSILSLRKRRNEDMGTVVSLVETALANSNIHLLGVFQDINKDTTFLAISQIVSDVDLSEFEKKLGEHLPGRNFPRLQHRPSQTLVTAVGHLIQKNPLLSAKLKITLENAGVVIQADAYRNTENSLSFLISEQDHLKAIQQLHNEVLSHA